MPGTRSGPEHHVKARSAIAVPAERPVLGQRRERIERHFPDRALGIGEIAVVAAPERLLRRFQNRGARRLGPRGAERGPRARPRPASLLSPTCYQ